MFFRKISFILALFLFLAGSSQVLAFDMPSNILQEEHVSVDNSDINGESDSGTRQIAGVLMKAADYTRIILASMAVFWMVWSGAQMVVSRGDDEQITKSKRGVVWSIIGLSVLLMLKPMILNVFYGGGAINPGEVLTEHTADSINAGKVEVVAFLKWMQAILVIVAVGFLVVSGTKMIFAFGEQEGVSKQRKAIVWIAVGFIVILLNEVVITQVIYNISLESGKVVLDTNPSKGTEEIVGVIKYFLEFLALLDFFAFIYGGFLMLASYGDDERVEKGKRIISGAVMGIIIIVISYALTASLLSGQVGG